MPEVRIRTIQFLKNNPSGLFVAGDLLDVYFDPGLAIIPSSYYSLSTTGGKVYLNGSEYTPVGFDYISIESSIVTIQEYNPLICSSDTLIEQRIAIFYPYFVYWTSDDHPSCLLNEDPCNLQILGTPAVVSASGQSSNDGEIAVSAISTRTIQYKLGSDFSYNDGSGHQNTGLFTGLLPGTYRIFLKDAAGCGTDILVNVPIDNTYGTRWRLDYNVHVAGQHRSNTRIDIQERSYVGSVTEICGGGTPIELSLRGEGETDKFYPFLSTNASIALMSETDFQFIDLFTNDPKRFKIVYQKDFLQGGGYETKWQGFVEPQIYQEAYSPAPYEVSITATDRIGSLREFVFAKPDGLPFTGIMRAMNLIAQCLNKTGLSLNILSGCNMYASGMDTGTSDDPLFQSFIDLRRFYLFDTTPTYDFVLRSILESFGLRVILSDNRWNLVRVEELVDEFDYREYSPNGDIVGETPTTGAINPIIERVPPENEGYWWVNNDQHMEVRPGYGKINVKYDMGIFPNILENGDFGLTSVFNPGLNTYSPVLNTFGFQIVNNGYTLSKTYETIDENNIALVITGDSNTNGTSYIQSATYNVKMGAANQLKFTFRIKIPNPIIEVPYQIVNALVKYGSYYLGTTGKWTTSLNFMRFFVTEFGKYIDLEVTADQPASDASSGLDIYVRLFHSYLWYYDYDGVTNLKAVATVNLPLSTKVIMRAAPGAFFTGERRIYYELEETTAAEAQPEVVRPNDYNSGSNPVQWVQKFSTFPETVLAFLNPPAQISINRSLYIDKIEVKYLYNGKEPVSIIELDKTGESNNSLEFSKTLYLGSLMNLITTKANFGFKLGFFGGSSGSLNIITENALSANLLYSGWLRKSDGTGWVNWTRDGVGESKKLHEIWQLMMAAQYNKSHRRITGSILSTDYFSFIKTLKETYDDDRLYIPMSGSFKDKQNIFTGEFIELVNINDTPAAPFNSGFTSGFGSSGFD